MHLQMDKCYAKSSAKRMCQFGSEDTIQDSTRYENELLHVKVYFVSMSASMSMYKL